MRFTGIPIPFNLEQIGQMLHLNWRYLIVYYETGEQYLYFCKTPEEVIACEQSHGDNAAYDIYDKKYHISKILLLPLAMRTTYISMPKIF